MIQTTQEPITIYLSRQKQYPVPGRSAMFGWKWLYTSTVPEIRLTAGAGLDDSDPRNLPLRIETNSLVEARATAKRVAPNSTVVLIWEAL